MSDAEVRITGMLSRDTIHYKCNMIQILLGDWSGYKTPNVNKELGCVFDSVGD